MANQRIGFYLFKQIMNQRSNEGDGIDSGEAKRSRLSPGFPLAEGNSENLETTAIERTIRNRNGHRCTLALIFSSSPMERMEDRGAGMR
ncbi:hypothetical protein [Paenibacillus xylanilyticus]|uniref:Uncharacterized protein n=1 Tax=Paenibacillus xylanilyticus TaxID=248903 RepID=A0A7Y6C0W0_9BACL|nr:hypothetical protein [Paenibacillus xylanilyticus]NUU78554.1 hypothetical protein [Paenibacillus xylanilyticus]